MDWKRRSLETYNRSSWIQTLGMGGGHGNRKEGAVPRVRLEEALRELNNWPGKKGAVGGPPQDNNGALDLEGGTKNASLTNNRRGAMRGARLDIQTCVRCGTPTAPPTSTAE